MGVEDRDDCMTTVKESRRGLGWNTTCSAMLKGSGGQKSRESVKELQGISTVNAFVDLSMKER
jgi:hypothetical protein